MDPRVRAPAVVLAQQFALSQRLAGAMRRDSVALGEVRAMQLQGGASDSLAALDRELTRLNGQLASLLGVVDGADVAPTTQTARAAETLERALAAATARWDAIRRGAR
jgi:hypothetical protein